MANNDLSFIIASKRYQDTFTQADAIRSSLRNSEPVSKYVGRDDLSGNRLLSTPDGSISFNRYDSNAAIAPGSVVNYSQLNNGVGQFGNLDTKPS